MTEHSDKPTKAPKPAVIPVINRANRLERIAYRVEGEILNGSQVFPPGLTFIDEATAKACGLGSKSDPFSGVGSLVKRNPLDLEDADAVNVARRSGDRSALRRWLEREKRESVRVAITSRLAGKSAAEAEAQPEM